MADEVDTYYTDAYGIMHGTGGTIKDKFKFPLKYRTAGGTPVDLIVVIDAETGDLICSLDGKDGAASGGAFLHSVGWISKHVVGGNGVVLVYISRSGFGTIAHGPYPVGFPIDVDDYWEGVSACCRFDGAVGQTWFFNDAGRFIEGFGGACLADGGDGKTALSLSLGAGVVIHDTKWRMNLESDWSPSRLVEAWVTLDGDQGGTETLILGCGDGSSRDETAYLFYLTGDSSTSRNRLVFECNDSRRGFKKFESEEIDFSFGVKHHVAFEIPNERLTLFFDGNPVGSFFDEHLFNGFTSPYRASLPYNTTVEKARVRAGRYFDEREMQLIGMIHALRFRRYTPGIFNGAAFVPAEILPNPATQWKRGGAVIPCAGLAGSRATKDAMGASVTFEGDAIMSNREWLHNGVSVGLSGSGSLLVQKIEEDDPAYGLMLEILIFPLNEERTDPVVIFDSRGSNAAAKDGVVLYLLPDGMMRVMGVSSGKYLDQPHYHYPPADDDGAHNGKWSRIAFALNQSGFGCSVTFEVNGWNTSLSWASTIGVTSIDPSGFRIGRAADGAGGFKGYISGIRTRQRGYVNRFSSTGQSPDLSLPFPILPRYRS